MEIQERMRPAASRLLEWVEVVLVADENATRVRGCACAATAKSEETSIDDGKLLVVDFAW